MLKKSVKFTGFDGQEHTEDVYLNMNRMESVKFLLAHGININKNQNEKDIKAQFQKIIDKGDIVQMLTFVDDLLLTMYGKRSEDGTRFIKNDAIREDFEQSLAHEALFNACFDDHSTVQEIVSSMSIG